MNALIIDDNPIDLKIISNLVNQSSELETVMFTSSSDALRWCKANEVDIVIVDCLMPAPNGIEFVYLLRKIRGKSDIPVIMITASDEREIKYQALEMGVNFFIRKPIDSTEFFVIINNTISMRRNQKRILLRERQLAESEEKFRVLSDKLPNMVVIFKDNQVVYANEIFLKTLDINLKDIDSEGMRSIIQRHVTLESQERMLEKIRLTALGDEKALHQEEFNLISIGGKPINVLVSTCKYYYGGEGAVIVIGTDITRQKQVEQALNERQRQLSTLVNNLPGIAYRCTNEKKWTMSYISGGCREITGFEPDEIIDSKKVSYADIILEEDREMVWDVVQRSIKTSSPYVIEYRIISKDGRLRWVWEKGTAVYEKGKLVALEGFITDITERKEAEQRLQYMAHYDLLTGLANRSLFFDRLNHAIRVAKRGSYFLALLYIDLDGFKFINDTYGHDIGDKVLEETAARLKLCVRESDTISRVGGDEFTVILTKVENQKSASIVAKKIINSIAEPYAIGDIQCSISASIGISIYYSGDEDTDAIIKKADIAMYRAKQSGRNCYTFYSV